MLTKKCIKYGLVIFSLIALLFSVLEIDAHARAGGGKSFGSRGSRSYSAPSSPSKSPTGPSRQMAPATAQPQSGGFLRGMAGGLAGGILGGVLGSMLFGSMGHAGTGGIGGSGFGLFEIALIGAILYGIWWFIKKRRREAEATATAGSSYYRETSTPHQPFSYGAQPSTPGDEGHQSIESNSIDGLIHVKQMDSAFNEQLFKDQCMDNFFKVQGAWANRDLSTIRTYLTNEMFDILQRDVDDLKSKKRINRLENIAVRSVDITEAWQETGKDYITVRFYANLLDYTVDEVSGQVLAGSKTEPVKFDEYWTFTRPVGNNPWQLSAINQA